MYGLLLTSFALLFSVNQSQINDGFAEYGAYDDIYADAHHYCCTQYTTKADCRGSVNYDCTFLNAKDDTDKAIIRRFGNRCVGQAFAKCKRKDIKARCFKGCQEQFCDKPICDLEADAEDLCLWDRDDYDAQEDEMILNHAMNMNSYHSTNNDYKLFGSIGLIVLVIASGIYYYKKRAQNNDKSTEIISSANSGEYGTTFQAL